MNCDVTDLIKNQDIAVQTLNVICMLRIPQLKTESVKSHKKKRKETGGGGFKCLSNFLFTRFSTLNRKQPNSIRFLFSFPVRFTSSASGCGQLSARGRCHRQTRMETGNFYVFLFSFLFYFILVLTRSNVYIFINVKNDFLLK